MRTDRTFVCVACRARSWPVRRCPGCGASGALGDLEITPLRDLEAKHGRALGGADAIGCAAWGVVLGAIVGGIVALRAEAVGVVEALGAVAFVALIVALARGRARPSPQPYRVLGSPVVRASAHRIARRGKVRARGTLTSPLGKRACVAYRLVGDRSADMPLDDGRAVAFTLIAAGEEIDVEADVATLELAVDEPPSARPIDAELVRWLAARGIDAKDELLAQEATLADGDEVEVIGTPREEARADGYRGHATRVVLADIPGSPLIVRSPPA